MEEPNLSKWWVTDFLGYQKHTDTRGKINIRFLLWYTDLYRFNFIINYYEIKILITLNFTEENHLVFTVETFTTSYSNFKELSTLILIYNTTGIHNRTLISLTKINTRTIEPRNTSAIPHYLSRFYYSSNPKKKKKKESDLVVKPPHSTRSRLPEEIYTDTRYKYALDANTMAVGSVINL